VTTTQETQEQKLSVVDDTQVETDENLNPEAKWKKYGSNKGPFVFGIDAFYLDAKYKVFIEDITWISQVIYVEDLTTDPIVIVGKKSFANHRGIRVVDIITEETFDDLADQGIELVYTYVDLADPVNGRCSYYTGRYSAAPTASSVIKKRDQRVKDHKKQLEEEAKQKRVAMEVQQKEAEREKRIADKRKEEDVVEETTSELVNENPVQILKDHLGKDIIEVEQVEGG